MATLSDAQIAKAVGKVRSTLTRMYATTPLSAIQKQSLQRKSDIEGPVVFSQDEFAAPRPEAGDVRCLVDKAIRSLGRGDERYTIPELSNIKVEWTGSCPRPNREGFLTSPPAEKLKHIIESAHNSTTIVYVYGGSFCHGTPATARPIVSKLVEQTGSRCCTIGYRLAPQDPFPAALIDVFLGYLALLYPPPDSHHPPIPASSIVFVGDSSGAALILSLIQVVLTARRAQKTDRPTVRHHAANVTIPMPAGLAIVSPAGDQAIALPSWKTNAAFDIFSRDTSPVTDKNYPSCSIWPADPPRSHVYCDVSLLCHPLVSPTGSSDWLGCPPLWLAIGQERLADCAKVIAQTAARQGVVVLWQMYERMPHCWITMFPQLKQSVECTKRCAQVIGLFAANGAIESAGDVISTTGKTRKVDVKNLTPLTMDEVEEMMRANTKHLKPWVGPEFPKAKI